MNTGAKIAIGCVVAVVGVSVIGAVGMVAFGYWAKQKISSSIEGVQKNSEQVNTYLKQARAYPFTPPADGVITESELVKFLDVRKRVFAVYQKYGDQLQAMDKQKQGNRSIQDSLQAMTTLAGAIQELRLTQAKALADVGLSPREYGYLVGAVYRTFYAHEIAAQSGGKQFSEVLGDAQKQIENVPRPPANDPNNPNAQAQTQALDAMRSQLQQFQQQAKTAVDVPPANLELFKRYETEIKKYVMPGLEVADAMELGLTTADQN
jgi:hypothetical protein